MLSLFFCQKYPPNTPKNAPKIPMKCIKMLKNSKMLNFTKVL